MGRTNRRRRDGRRATAATRRLVALAAVLVVCVAGPMAARIAAAAAGPAVGLDPAALAFGEQAVGTASAPRTVTVANTGDAALTITSATLAGTDPSHFRVAADACTAKTLAPAATCTVGIAFAPTTAGLRAATLTFADNAPGSPHAVALSGTAVGTAVADAFVSYNPVVVNDRPTAPNRDPQRATGAPDGQTVSLGDGGSIVLRFVDNTLTGSGTAAADLRVVEGGPEAERVSVEVSGDALTWIPAGKVAGPAGDVDLDAFGFGPADRLFYVRLTDDPDEGEQNDASAAVGADIDAVTALTSVLPASSALVQPPRLAFDDQPVGTTGAAQTVTLTNTGNAPLAVASAVVAGGHANDFAKRSDTCSGATLAPAGTCAVSVAFAPAATGARTAGLVLTDSARGSPRRVELAGTGTTAASQGLTLTPPAVDFGNQPVGTVSPVRTVTVTNPGTQPVTVTGASVQGLHPREFPLVLSSCTGAALAPGATCALGVVFAPAVAEIRSGTLVISTTAPAGPRTVLLSGTGTAAETTTTTTTTTTTAADGTTTTSTTPSPTSTTSTSTPDSSTTTTTPSGSTTNAGPGDSSGGTTTTTVPGASGGSAGVADTSGSPGGDQGGAADTSGSPGGDHDGAADTMGSPGGDQGGSEELTETPFGSLDDGLGNYSAGPESGSSGLANRAPRSGQTQPRTGGATTPPADDGGGQGMPADSPFSNQGGEPSNSATAGTLLVEGADPASEEPASGDPMFDATGEGAGLLLAASPSGDAAGPPGGALDVAGSGYPPGCDRVYFFFDGVRVGMAEARDGAAARRHLSVPGDARPGAHRVTSACRASGKPEMNAADFTVTEASLHRTAFATAVPKPRDVDWTSEALVVSALAALALLALIFLSTRLFDATMRDHGDEVRRWFRLRSPERAAGAVPRLALALLFVVLTGPLWFAVHGRAELDASTAVGAVGLSLATAVVVAASGLLTVLYLRRNYKERVTLVALPASLAVALAAVVLSRVVDFQPGFFYGLVGGLAFSRRLHDDTRGRLAATSAGVVLGIGLLAWAGAGLLTDEAAAPGAGLPVVAAEAVLAGIFWVALGTLAIGLFPQRPFGGRAILAWDRRAWAVLYGVVLFAFVHLLVRPGRGFVAGDGTLPAVVLVAVVGAFAAFSICLWAHFRMGEPRPPAVDLDVRPTREPSRT